MKNRKISVHIMISIVICTLIVLKYLVQATLFMVPFLSALSGIEQEACSVGIIGGADGPTAIFLSSPYRFIFIIPAIEFIGLIYILIVLLQCHRKIRKDDPK